MSIKSALGEVGFLKGYLFGFSSKAENRSWIISKRQADEMMAALNRLADDLESLEQDQIEARET